jgi:hypothetical protein
MADTLREPGVIRADCAYSLDQVKNRLGLGTAAIRTARRKGLTVRRVGRKSFVLGADLLTYIQEHANIVV